MIDRGAAVNLAREIRQTGNAVVITDTGIDMLAEAVLRLWDELGKEKMRRIEANELLGEIARSGVQLEDARLDYLVVQIDRETWNAISKDRT